MSSTGIKALSSGPLIIRTYLNSSINNTFILGEYDVPISNGRVLITSSGGLLAPSNNITISSINVSSLGASIITGSTIISNNINVSTLIASTIMISSITTSTINVLNMNTSSISASSILTSSILTSSILTSSISASFISTNYLTVNSTATISTLNTCNETVRYLTISSNGGINTNSPYDTIIGGPAQNIQLNASNINITDGNLNVAGTAISRVAISTILTDPGSFTFNWLNLFGKYCFVNGGSVNTITLPTSPTPLDGTIIIIRNTGIVTITAYTTVGPVGNIGNSTFAGKTSSYVYVNGVSAGWYAL